MDTANYVSLRAFLGKLGDKLQDRIVDDSGDADLPSVEEFLNRCVGWCLSGSQVWVWVDGYYMGSFIHLAFAPSFTA